MPVEKQIAWLLRLFITVSVAAFGTISWAALQKLDTIVETQAMQTAQMHRVLDDLQRKSTRLDVLYDLHHRMGDRVRDLELQSRARRGDDS